MKTNRRVAFRVLGLVLLYQIVIVLGVYISGGTPAGARGVFYLPAVLMIVGVVGFGVAAFAGRWLLAFWSAVILTSSALGMYIATSACYVMAPIAASRARGFIMDHAASASRAGPADHESEMLARVHGWGWHAYIIKTQDGDVLCVRDIWRESGWNYLLSTKSWTRVTGVSLADSVLVPTGFRGCLILIFVGGVAAGLFARHKILVGAPHRANREHNRSSGFGRRSTSGAPGD